MSDTLLSGLVSAGVALAAVVVSYLMTRKSISAAISSLKQERLLVKMQDFPGEMSGLLDKIRFGQPGDDATAYLVRLQSEIYAYGSVSAVRIFAYMQQTNYAMSGGADGLQWTLLACTALLVSQLKLDLTDQALPAEYWFQVRLTDYVEHREQIRRAISETVDLLGIDKRFALPSTVETPSHSPLGDRLMDEGPC